MFKLRRSQKVRPDVQIRDAYIKRRYEDLSVCIHKDIKNGRGQYNYYAPWVELMLLSFPAHFREKHSVLEHKLHEPGDVQTIDAQAPTDIFTKSMGSAIGKPKNAWVQEDKVAGSRSSVNTNEALLTPENTTVLSTVKTRMVAESEADLEAEARSRGHTTTVSVQHQVSCNRTQTEEANPTKEIDRGIAVQDEGLNSVEFSSTVEQRGHSVRSKVCTIL